MTSSVSADTDSTAPDDAPDDAAAVRDPDRFGEIFDRYFPEIHGYVARRLGRDIADDVAAETFLAAFRSRHRFDASRGTVRAWLYGIATNHLSAYHRQEIRACKAMAAANETVPADGTATEPLADQVAARVDAGTGKCCCW